MKLTQIMEVLQFSMPLICSLICVLLIMRSYGQQPDAISRRLNLLLGLTLTFAVLIWSGILCYRYAPEFFVRIHCLYFLIVLYNQIFFFHFVFTLTQSGTNRRFSPIHYIYPVMFAGALFVWSLFVPFESQLYIVTHNGDAAPGYALYSVFFVSKMPLWSLMYIAYGIVEVIWLLRHRRVLQNYSADMKTASMRWLNVFLIIYFFDLPLSFIDAIVPRKTILGSMILVIPILAEMVQIIILTYNIIAGNYLVILKDKEEKTEPLSAKILSKGALIKRLEAYMISSKPYLQPNLKITDLTIVLHTNRTTLSTAINDAYGMNFSQWVNGYRLREFEQLTLDPFYISYSKETLAEAVGFSNYRSMEQFKKKYGDAKNIN